MATISTSARLRLLHLGLADTLSARLSERLPALIQQITEETLAPCPTVMLYMPVVHQGYDGFLEEYGQKAQILLIGQSFAEQYPVIRKEIRALSPARVAQYIKSVHAVSEVRVIEKEDLPQIIIGPSLILPDEDLMHGSVAQRFNLNDSVQLHFKRTFLRWDKS